MLRDQIAGKGRKGYSHSIACELRPSFCVEETTRENVSWRSGRVVRLCSGVGRPCSPYIEKGWDWASGIYE